MTEPITAADVGHGADERARVVVVGRADEYRRRAQQCLEMAAAFRDRDARVALSHMAQAWLSLAERSDLARPSAQAVVHQQQQVQPKQGRLGAGEQHDKNR
jgi:hypothetical protein